MTTLPREIDFGVSLADKYDLAKGRVYVTGSQAIVRLVMMQRARDIAAGHNTAGYVSGYRGSPVGGLDSQFERARAETDASHIKFHPGLNEDIAATALSGTQQVGLFGEGRYDGVFGLWYAKGPGVDRSGDALRHANLAGTAELGGVIALAGDDHLAESSSTAHQSEFALVDAMIPILNPAGIQDLLDFGILGYAMSRYCGAWVGIKAVKDTMDATASVDGDPARVAITMPEGFMMPPGGLNIRAITSTLTQHVLEQEALHHEFRLPAALAFARANRIDRTIISGGPRPRLGIAAAGKSYLDVRQALDMLGIDEAGAADLGIRLYKIAMTWPLEPQGLASFADGLELVVVVEEKRSLIEAQMREQLYGRAGTPVIIGKRDERDRPLFSSGGALDSREIAIVLGERLVERGAGDLVAARLADLKAMDTSVALAAGQARRVPYFCAGCPHNTSTKVPEGGRALAGIGCHYMAAWMDRSTVGVTQMGAEGASWIGEAPFSTREHIYANLGDGTYNHSGILAIRAAVYAGVTMTYKILFNDAVALTGGQANDGGLTVDAVARQIAAEGVERIVVVSDEPEKYGSGYEFPRHVAIEHRAELDRVQRELADTSGVTALIYDQTCAAEKRRRRKRGTYADPPKRVLINELVCEGCGDCGVQSNCVAIEPVETEYGRKRAINQSVCNKDFSCLDGFCPSFVTVHGGKPRTGAGRADGGASEPAGWDALPEPKVVRPERAFSIVVTGIGGTGVVTIGSLLGMAAHLEGKGCGVLDMIGLSQKNGAVTSYVRIAESPEAITSVRVAAGGADLVLGCDIVTTGTERTLALMRKGRTGAVVNTHLTMTADFTRNPNLKLDCDATERAIAERIGAGAARFIDAGRLAGALMGDDIASNMFLVGVASQAGRLPVSPGAIERAIELNGVAVEMNRAAFRWGRRAALDEAAVEALASADCGEETVSAGLDEAIERRAAFLEDYQDRAYADRYRALVERARAAEGGALPASEAFADAVARAYFKLLAYKDEYEVARLFTGAAFDRQLKTAFEGPYRLEFHLAPPVLGRRAADGAPPRKRSFGPWMMTLFRLLARGKRLRGTRLDPFGYTAERRMERRLIGEYETRVGALIARLGPRNLEIVAEIAALPLAMRGFGHVKAANVEAARAREAELLTALDEADGELPAAVARVA